MKVPGRRWSTVRPSMRLRVEANRLRELAVRLRALEQERAERARRKRGGP